MAASPSTGWTSRCRSASREAGCSCSHATCAAARSCLSTTRSSRRRLRMTSTDEPLGAHHYTDDEMHNEDVAHELTDANVRTVLAFGVGILATVAVSALLMYGYMRVLEHQAVSRDP